MAYGTSSKPLDLACLLLMILIRYQFMEQDLFNILSTGSLIQAIGLLAGSIFFLIAGLQDFKSENMYGLLYVALGVFFGAGHILLVTNIPDIGEYLFKADKFDLQAWFVMMVAPAIILVLILRGLFWLVFWHVKAGLYRLFFGSTLYCYMFMIGQTWPPDIRGFLALIWGFFLFAVELYPQEA